MDKCAKMYTADFYGGITMDLLQLRYFMTVAQEEHISRAANKLMVAQPSLSKMIKNLEGELGCPLFDRVGKNIRLNENGRIVLAHTEKIFSQLSDMKRELWQSENGDEGEVRLSVVASTGWLPEIITGFKKEYPKIDIVISQKPYGASGGDDIYIYSSTQPPQEGETLLLKENCLLAMPEDHRLAEGETPLCDSDIASLENDSFFVMENRRPLWDITYDLCRRAGFTPHTALECDSRDTIFALVKAGLGVAFVPELTWKASYNAQGIAVRALENSQPRYILMRCSEGFMPACVKKLREHLVWFYNSKLYH